MPKSETSPPIPEFVSKIVKDPNKPAGVVLLSGFPGPASESGHTRLYFDPQLSQYVEIPNEAIVHFQPLGSESSPPGGVYVWVRREAELVRAKAEPVRAQARFFEGPLAQAAAGLRTAAALGNSIGGVGGGCDTPACTGAHITCWNAPLAAVDSIGGPGGGCSTPNCTEPHITCAPITLAAGKSIGGPGGGCDTPCCTVPHISCLPITMAAANSIGGAGGGCDTPACTGAHIKCWLAPLAAGAPAWPTWQCTPPWPTYVACPPWPTYAGCPK